MRKLDFFSLMALSVALTGCGSKEPISPPAPKSIALAAGTEVSLVLLRQISAGSTREGTIVPFMVEEDVRDPDGNILIEKGTIAEGEVSWSRSEGSLGGLMNQPARLAVKIRRTRGPSNETIELAASKEKPDEPFQFTRENTGLDEARISSTAMVQLSDSAVAKTIATAIQEFFETGEASKLNLDGEAKEWLKKLGQDNGMSALNESIDKGGSDLEKVIRHVRDGSITRLAGADLVLAVTAVQELGRLANSIEHGLSSKLKGRTIKAYVGTPVKAYVAKETLVKAKAPSN